MLFRILLLSFSLPNSLAAEEDPVASSRTVFLSRYVLRICLNYLFYRQLFRKHFSLHNIPVRRVNQDQLLSLIKMALNRTMLLLKMLENVRNSG